MAVSPDGGGMTDPAAGAHSYNDGTVVNITATPDAGYEFVNWTGDVADPNSATTTVTMNADKTVTARFITDNGNGGAGGCGCPGSEGRLSGNELIIGFCMTGLCWGTAYWVARRAKRRGTE